MRVWYKPTSQRKAESHRCMISEFMLEGDVYIALVCQHPDPRIILCSGTRHVVQIQHVLCPQEKTMRKPTALVSLFIFVSAFAMAGKNRKYVPPAPLPAVIVNAQTVFHTNG